MKRTIPFLIGLLLTLGLAARGLAPPELAKLQPSSLPAGGPGQWVSFLGDGFTGQVVGVLAGRPRETRKVSSQELLIWVSATDLAEAQTLEAWVDSQRGQSNHLVLLVTASSPPPSEPPPPSQGLLPALTPPYAGPLDPRRIPLELQAWWNSGAAPFHDFGHLHLAANVPLGQAVSGLLTFDARIVVHNNPSKIVELRVQDDHAVVRRIYLDPPLECPFDGVMHSVCAWNVPVSIDTSQLVSGWRELRLRAEGRTVDGNHYLNSSGIPVFVVGGLEPRQDYNRWCGNTSLMGRGWYDGFDYTAAVIECVPLAPVFGVWTVRVRAQQPSVRLTVLLDRSHAIPAAGP